MTDLLPAVPTRYDEASAQPTGNNAPRLGFQRLTRKQKIILSEPDRIDAWITADYDDFEEVRQ
jgi:hypothetical protein